RRFNQSGIQAFRLFLASCRESSGATLPRHSLEDDALTESVKPEIRLQPRNFTSRRDASAYFHTMLKQLPPQEVAVDSGLWTWMSLFFFDEVCPVINGRRRLKNDYSYIFEPKNPHHYYRHLLFLAWYVGRIASGYNRLYLDVPLSGLDEVTRIVMGGLYLTRIPCLFEVLDRL